MLVQIDGRTVYTPVFSGTYWDVQDVVLEDIDRIEVIRGPGATVWGANAVNGVINILTKTSVDTQGIYAKAGGGTEERGFSTARVGGTHDNLTWRAYGKWFDRGPQFTTGGPDGDDWQMGRGGFRMDWNPSECDRLTFQGDVYDGSAGTSSIFDGLFNEEVDGNNVLARWTHTIDDDRDYTLQVYYDVRRRDSPSVLQHVETFDVDFQGHRRAGCNHELTWGVGYRRVHDFLDEGLPTTVLRFDPIGYTANLYTGFLQDEITLLEDKWYLTIGTKVGKNAYSGFEVQPSIRTLWLLDKRHVAWGAISRAVRTPARFTHATTQVGVFTTGPHPNFDSEELIAYEVGYRAQTSDTFSWDLACYYNVYEDLRNSSFVGGTTYEDLNEMDGHIYGLETSASLELTPCWRMQGWYAYSNARMNEPFNAVFPKKDDSEGNSPANQVSLMSSWDLGCDVEADVTARYVDYLSNANALNYISLDMRLGWRPTNHLEFSVVGQNLLDAQHKEMGNQSGAPQYVSEIRRGVYGQAIYRY